MKIILLLGSIMLGLAFTSTAQITINRSDLGNLIGATVYQAYDSTNLNTLSPGNAGENQTWDLTGISNDYQDTMQFLSPSGISCSNDFASATLALVDTGMYIYLYDDNTVLEMLGFCGVIIPPDPISIPYYPPKKLVTFPSTFSTSFSGQTKAIIQFPNNPPPPDSVRIVQTITYTSLVDGWGNVTTPIETYPSLRQKYTEYQVDSIFIYFTGTGWQPIGTPTIDTTIEYNWWSQNNLFIAGIITDGRGNVQSANYLLLLTLGVNETQVIPLATSVFPNPSKGKFTITVSNSSINAIGIYNMMGEKVFLTSGIKQEISEEIDLSDYPKGIYFIKIYTGEKTHTAKVVIQ